MIYRGDAKYKYIVLVPAVAGVLGVLAIRNRARNAIPYV
jgi:hypothetical protein